MAGHHVTFTVAFNRSYDRLSKQLQQRLRLLSIFSFPFFAQAAAFVWGVYDQDGAPDTSSANPDLGRLARASLLEIEGYFPDGTPATYRFQPALMAGNSPPPETTGTRYQRNRLRSLRSLVSKKGLR